LQHKNPGNSASTLLGAHLQPRDPNQTNDLHLNFNLNQSIPHFEEDIENSGGEDDVIVSTTELKKKAARRVANQMNSKVSPSKIKPKKKK
jgi:hypothetical protein